MGLTYGRPLELADRERIDHRLGFQVDDLIRLSMKLAAVTPDAEEKARLRAATATFKAIRDLDRAA
jgi:hypothetical protein